MFLEYASYRHLQIHNGYTFAEDKTKFVSNSSYLDHYLTTMGLYRYFRMKLKIRT